MQFTMYNALEDTARGKKITYAPNYGHIYVAI